METEYGRSGEECPEEMRKVDVKIIFKRSPSPFDKFFDYLRDLADKIDTKQY